MFTLRLRKAVREIKLVPAATLVPLALVVGLASSSSSPLAPMAGRR